MTSDERAVDAHNLYRFFRAGDEETLALRGVSLSADRGQIVAVVGPSGSGKSTLLNCLAGLDEPDGGTVTVAGQRVSHRPEPERARIRARRIGILMQSGNLLNHLDLISNIRVAQLAAGSHHQDRPEELLHRVGLVGRRHAYPHQLSGGELARAGLAVALANNPTVVLADEPTGELDGHTELQVLELLAEQVQRGAALVVVTHSRGVAAIADRIITLDDGEVST